MHFTFDKTYLYSVFSPKTTTSYEIMTIGTPVQNRGSQASSKTLHIQDRNWKPRKHQRNDKTNWMKQNNQSRSVGWKFGDKQRMEANV